MRYSVRPTNCML